MAVDTNPTVIVARTASEGREAEFETWLNELVGEAANSPGFLGAEIQPPTSVHPREWIVIYRFVDMESLKAWLDSPERTSLMEQSSELMEGSPRTQVLAMNRDIDPVTAVISARVAPEFHDEYLALYHDINYEMSRAPGFVRSELFEPVPGVQDETVAVFTFDGRKNLDAWLASPERQAILVQMDQFVAGRTVNVLGGFGGWFHLTDGREARRWKQGVVVLLALYPVVIAITLLKRALLPKMPLPLDILVGNIASVALLTWVLMPFLTRKLAGWLRR